MLEININCIRQISNGVKIDFHTHSYYSEDGISSAKKLLETALKKGLDGIALTDHNTTAGWKEAIETAKKLKAVLVLGEEIRIREKGKIIGEVLGYFLKKEINSKGKTLEEVIEEIKKQGGLLIVSHPFSWRKSFQNLEKYKNLVDGIEVFNSRTQTKKENQKSFDFAQKNNLAMIAGSDAHSCFEVGNAYIEADVKNLEELKEAILNKKVNLLRESKTPEGFRIIQLSNKVKIIGKQSPIFFQIFAFLGRLLHLFWKPKIE